MLSVLDDDLMTVTDATSPKEPGESSTAEDQVKWQEQDDQAKAVIMFSAMADDLTTVTDATSSRNLESRQQLRIKSNGKNRMIRRKPSSCSLSWPMTLRL